MEDPIINRVANSQILILDLEELYTPGERILFDISHWLYSGMVLKEKDFREFVRVHNWSQYCDKLVAITCTADAIVPTWAYMLLTVTLQPVARKVMFGTLSELETELFQESLNKMDWEKFRDEKVVIKGCSKVKVPVAVYVAATSHLRGLASSIAYGEPCSTVPLFKRKPIKSVS